MNKLPFITAVFRINNSTVHRGAIVLFSIYLYTERTDSFFNGHATTKLWRRFNIAVLNKPFERVEIH